MFHSNLYVWRKKPFFVKYLNLYKKMLEKDMGSVYKTCFIACGRGSPRFNTYSQRELRPWSSVSAVLYLLKHFICCLFVE